MTKNILLGAIADDFTGATDLANILVRGGMRTVQTIGVPAAETELPECDAVVVALKSRTIPAPVAVRQSLAALGAQGVRHAVVDAVRDEDLFSLGAACRKPRLLTDEQVAELRRRYPT